MFRDFFRNDFRVGSLIFGLIFFVSMTGGCTVEAAKNESENQTERPEIYTVAAEKQNVATKGTIDIEPQSPADTIRIFYKNLREKRFREAIFLTNLRPAIEGLTDSELKDLEVDFSLLAQTVPPDLQINGEIISNETASVTAKIPNDESGKLELKEFKLKRESGGWLILLADQEAESQIKKEGKNYFFSLRMEVHQAEAEKMMNRIAKAQIVYSIQNGGAFGEMKTLVDAALLPADVQNAASTGYRYEISLSADKKRYKATAEPETYNKTGKISYVLEAEGSNQTPRLKSADLGGKPIKD